MISTVNHANTQVHLSDNDHNCSFEGQKTTPVVNMAKPGKPYDAKILRIGQAPTTAIMVSIEELQHLHMAEHVRRDEGDKYQDYGFSKHPAVCDLVRMPRDQLDIQALQIDCIDQAIIDSVDIHRICLMPDSATASQISEIAEDSDKLSLNEHHAKDCASEKIQRKENCSIECSPDCSPNRKALKMQKGGCDTNLNFGSMEELCKVDYKMVNQYVLEMHSLTQLGNYFGSQVNATNFSSVLQLREIQEEKLESEKQIKKQNSKKFNPFDKINDTKTRSEHSTDRLKK